MRRFDVEDDLVKRVWLLAEPKPFENLTFSEALRRALQKQHPTLLRRNSGPTEFLGRSNGGSADSRKKAPSPSAPKWVSQVPELAGVHGLTNWTAICDHLGIDPAGDSARRKLKAWVSSYKPSWPAVPELSSDA